MVKMCAAFHREMYTLLQKKLLCDVTIVDDNGQTIEAHSCILAASSAVLRNKLCGMPLPLHLHLPHLSFTTWMLVLEFIYKGDLDFHSNIQNLSNLEALNRAATELHIKELKNLLSDWSKHPNKSKITSPLQVGCFQRERSTQTSVYSKDGNCSFSQLTCRKKQTHSCRFCETNCSSRFGIIQHVFRSCVRLHSSQKKRPVRDHSLTDRQQRYKRRCRVKKDSVSQYSSQHLSRDQDRVSKNENLFCNEDTITSDEDTGICANEGQPDIISSPARDEAIGSTDKIETAPTQTGSQVSAETEEYDEGDSKNKLSLHTKMPDSLKSTQLLLQAIRRQNEAGSGTSLKQQDSQQGHFEAVSTQQKQSVQNTQITGHKVYVTDQVETLNSNFTKLNEVVNSTNQREYFQSSHNINQNEKEHSTAMTPLQQQSMNFTTSDIVNKTGDYCAALSKPKAPAKTSLYIQRQNISGQGERSGELVVKRNTGPGKSTASRQVNNKKKKKGSSRRSRLYVCIDEECGAVFTRLKQYTTHLRSCLTGGDYVDPEKCLQQHGNMFTLSDDKTEVPEGGMKCPSFSLIDRHCQTGGRKRTKQYSCSHCVHTEVGLGRILAHVTNVHRKLKPYRCRRCHQRFFGFQELKDHVLRFHVSVRTVMCRHCTAKFSCKSALRSHIKQEHGNAVSGRRRYKCTWCSKVFKLRHQQRRHEMSHLRREERPHACRVCGHRFSTRETVKSHMYLHTGVKPFRCPKCVFKATRKSHLQLHMRTHGLQIVDYKCATCQRTFVLNSRLRDHLKKHGHVAQKLLQPLYEPIPQTPNTRQTKALPSPYSSQRATSTSNQLPAQPDIHINRGTMSSSSASNLHVNINRGAISSESIASINVNRGATSSSSASNLHLNREAVATTSDLSFNVNRGATSLSSDSSFDINRGATSLSSDSSLHPNRGATSLSSDSSFDINRGATSSDLTVSFNVNRGATSSTKASSFNFNKGAEASMSASTLNATLTLSSIPANPGSDQLAWSQAGSIVSPSTSAVHLTPAYPTLSRDLSYNERLVSHMLQAIKTIEKPDLRVSDGTAAMVATGRMQVPTTGPNVSYDSNYPKVAIASRFNSIQQTHGKPMQQEPSGRSTENHIPKETKSDNQSISKQAFAFASPETSCLNLLDKYSLMSGFNVPTCEQTPVTSTSKLSTYTSYSHNRVASSLVHHLPKPTTTSMYQQHEPSPQYQAPGPRSIHPSREAGGLALSTGGSNNKHIETKLSQTQQGLPMFTLLSKVMGTPRKEAQRGESTITNTNFKDAKDNLHTLAAAAIEVEKLKPARQDLATPVQLHSSHHEKAVPAVAKQWPLNNQDLSVKSTFNQIRPSLYSNPKPVLSKSSVVGLGTEQFLGKYSEPCVQLTNILNSSESMASKCFVPQKLGQRELGQGSSEAAMDRQPPVYTVNFKNSLPPHQEYSALREHNLNQRTGHVASVSHLQPKAVDRYPDIYQSYLDQPPPEIIPKVVLQYPGISSHSHTASTATVRNTRSEGHALTNSLIGGQSTGRIHPDVT